MKKALVLGGGGSKGAYEIGVWKALKELDEHFDIVCGTSIGAMIGVLYVQQDYDKAYQLWHDLKIDDVMANGINLDLDMELIMSQKDKYKPFFENFVQHKGADISPFEQMIHELFDAEKFFSSSIDYGCMCVNVTRHKAHPVMKKEMNASNVLDYVMASASCYPAFPMKEIEDEKFVDGGYADNVPITLARSMGADSIVAVDLKSVGRTIIKQPQEDLIYIEPYVSLGSFLLFDHDKIMENMQLGYLDTMKKYGRYLGTIYTFIKEDNSSMDQFEVLMQAGFQHLKETIDADKMHLLTEKITSISLLRGLKKYEGYDMPFCAMLEHAAQAFDMEYGKIYCFDDFKGAVLRIVDAYLPNENASLTDIENVKELLSSIKNNKARDLISISYFYLIKDEKSSALIQLLATMTNDSFLIAYLLYLMKIMDR